MFKIIPLRNLSSTFPNTCFFLNGCGNRLGKSLFLRILFNIWNNGSNRMAAEKILLIATARYGLTAKLKQEWVWEYRNLLPSTGGRRKLFLNTRISQHHFPSSFCFITSSWSLFYSGSPSFVITTDIVFRGKWWSSWTLINFHIWQRYTPSVRDYDQSYYHPKLPFLTFIN